MHIFPTASEKLIPEGSYIPGVLAVAWNLHTAGHFSNCRLWSVASLCALVDGGRPLMFFSLIFLCVVNRLPAFRRKHKENAHTRNNAREIPIAIRGPWDCVSGLA